ncbi:MAG: AMP-binding protein [Hydrogenophilaceae bacterium]|jgi:fatty-acyl-CoA synthase|nr:AMP-binding protein [Hydrogenophilaceae bacterium]
MPFTIKRALQWWARERADELALSVDGAPCTFAALYDWSARIGAFLQARGVRPGDRVSMVAMNSLSYAALIFGVMRIGAIGAPINFRSTPSEIAAAFEALTPSLVLADEERMAAVRDAAGDITVLSLHEIEALRECPSVAIAHEPAPDDAAFIIGTSGSTGRAKGVVYSHRTVMTYAAEFAITQPLCGAGSRVFSPGPFSSSSGYLLLNEFIALGATLFIESQFRPERALDLLVGEKITTFQAAPIFFERIAALPAFAGADLSSLHFAQAAGARVPPALLRTWQDKGVVLRHAYGSTEAGGGWAAQLDTALSAPEKCGRGGMFTEYAIRGADGGFARAGETGEILVRSACLTPGYWNNPEATCEAIKDGWLHTGDIGLMDADGNLTFVDRLKDIIISGGLNISASEVESVINEVEGVSEVAVIAARDADFGETPLAIVHGDASRFTVQAIIARCTEKLARYKTPRYVVIEPAPLPRLPSGKISKPALRERYGDAGARLQKVR